MLVSLPIHLVKWVQADDTIVDSWEFQYSHNGITWYWVQSVDPVDGCSNCYEAAITIPPEVMMVRSRAIGMGGVVGGDFSGWSSVHYLPEFGVGQLECLSLLFSFALLLLLGRSKSKRSSSYGT